MTVLSKHEAAPSRTVHSSRIHHLLFFCGFFVVTLTTPRSAVAQDLADSLLITVADGNGLRNTLVLGHHDEATLDFDWALREAPVPPVPIDQIFDVRFLDPPGFPRRPSTGTYRDIRGTGTAVADTFNVTCQPMNGGFPMTMKWNPALAFVQYAIAEIRSRDGSRRLCDIRSTHEFVIGDRDVAQFMIIIRRM